MIRINLLGEKEDKRGVYLIQLLVACLSLFLCFIILSTLHFSAKDNLQSLKTEKDSLERSLTKLAKKTKAVEELEKKEKLLREKLTTIATLKAKKQGPVRVLDEVTQTIPERSWVNSIKEKNGFLTVEGIALDNQTVASFMDRLEKSLYFKNVLLNFAREYLKDNVKLQEFSLSIELENLLEIKKKREEMAKIKEENKEI